MSTGHLVICFVAFVLTIFQAILIICLDFKLWSEMHRAIDLIMEERRDILKKIDKISTIVDDLEKHVKGS